MGNATSVKSKQILYGSDTDAISAAGTAANDLNTDYIQTVQQR